jgi:arylsulfatase A-like enzyme
MIRLLIPFLFLLLVACGQKAGDQAGRSAKGAGKIKNLPNVIVVLADDIGLGDISYYRSKHTDQVIVSTPNIDELAENGMAFTDAHSPAALCAPSRYAIMTGNSCWRSPRPWGVWGAYEKSPIAEDQLTLGTLMKQAGYQTAFFGKWHLGGDFYRKDDPSTIYRGPRNKPELDVDITRYAGAGPKSRGFDYSITFPAGIQNVPYAVYENEVWMPLAEDSEIGYISQENMSKIGVKLDKSEGLGDLNWDPHDMGPLLAGKAVGYIGAHAGQEDPFFIYYCSQAVHLPHTPPEELNGVKIAGAYASKHMDMIGELDVQMGMLVNALREKEVYENTLFIFTSDNGGLLRRETLKTGHQPSDIYRGGKNQCYEGGHRVPFIACWPNQIESGQTSDEPVLGLDVLATLAAITGLEIPEGQAMDSHNLLPIMQALPGAKGHEYLVLQSGTGNELIITNSGWKLILQSDRTQTERTPLALFNLNENPGEKEEQNLINDESEQVRIRTLLEKYNSIRDE